MIDELLDWNNVEPPETPQSANASPWKLLVVDDDPEVHSVTRFVLHDLRIFDRPLRLLHAHSAQEARERLRQHPDIAAALVDVVMETDQAGLDLVDYIRNHLGLAECRLILRTGQPGYAPELTVIHQYDINDYRTKAELTHTRLITTVSAALRAYEQLRALAENRRGLELIIHATAQLMEQRAIASLAEGILTQLAALLKLPLDGVVCTQRGSPFGVDTERYYVVGAAGHYAPYIAQPLERLPNRRIVEAILESVAKHQHVFGKDYTVLYLKAAPGQQLATFLDSGQALTALDRPLVEVFAANITACFRNVNLVEHLNYIAYHDPLTRLPNRLRFVADLDLAVQARTDAVAALLDINHFADLNDGLGEDTGNLLLVAVAERLRGRLESTCRLARIGADLFGVLGPEAWVNPFDLMMLFHAPFQVGEYQLPVNITLGLCRTLDSAKSGLDLLKQVNVALNHAKRNLSTHHEYYLAAMEENTRRRVEIIRRLRLDFQAEKLQVWYQPQIVLATGDVIGMEALLRWPGDGGFVQPPDVFIPLAEYSGLILQIGAWVLEQACAQHTRLAAAGFESLKIAVNVNMPQFRKVDFVEEIACILANCQIPPLLELEITESIAMDEPKAVAQRLGALKRLGILIAIDDFGTGYSSLGHLQSLPIDCLKIDRSFINKIDRNEGGLFVETIVGLSQKLRVNSVAEGVETQEQAEFLRGLGCAMAQGYLYAQPMPPDQIVAWLRERAAPQPWESTA